MVGGRGVHLAEGGVGLGGGGGGVLVEVPAPTVLQLVTRAEEGGGDEDHDHPELPEVLPYRVGTLVASYSWSANLTPFPKCFSDMLCNADSTVVTCDCQSKTGNKSPNSSFYCLFQYRRIFLSYT